MSQITRALEFQFFLKSPMSVCDDIKTCRTHHILPTADDSTDKSFLDEKQADYQVGLNISNHLLHLTFM